MPKTPDWLPPNFAFGRLREKRHDKQFPALYDSVRELIVASTNRAIMDLLRPTKGLSESDYHEAALFVADHDIILVDAGIRPDKIEAVIEYAREVAG